MLVRHLAPTLSYNTRGNVLGRLSSKLQEKSAQAVFFDILKEDKILTQQLKQQAKSLETIVEYECEGTNPMQKVLGPV